jgi:hypothetical protein
MDLNSKNLALAWLQEVSGVLEALEQKVSVNKLKTGYV